MKKVLIGVTFLSFLFFIMIKIPVWVKNNSLTKYRSIDRNGLAIAGTIFSKSTYHGKWISFTYSFNGTIYKDEMQDEYLFSIVELGDSVNIILDTTKPKDSYVSSKIQ